MRSAVGSRTPLFRKHYALPGEHGAWIWWIGPLVIGVTAGGSLSADVALLGLGAIAIFLLRQPATIAVKALSGRRAKSDLFPALAWAAGYAAVSALSLGALVGRGYTEILWLGIPGAIVFGWHLLLVSRREERGQMGVELVGAGVLALAAPAGYWVAGGGPGTDAWILWAITWLQSAASIVLVYLRLKQRRLEQMPEKRERWRMGARALAYHVFNVVLSGALVLLARVPWAVPLAFSLMLVDALDGIAHPPIGFRPARIGLRQLGASILFVLIVAGGYAL